MSKNDDLLVDLGVCGGTIRVDRYQKRNITCDTQPDQIRLESIKAAILAISEPEQLRVYEFLYSLGHRIYR